MKGIKIIEINTSYIFYCYNPDYYSDVLRISKNRISYLRKYISNDKSVKWLYRPSIEDYNLHFNNFCKDLYSFLHKNDDVTIKQITDCGYYSIKLIFDDDSEEIFNYSSNFAFNDMQDIANQIMLLIPCGYLYPDFLLSGEIEDIDSDLLDVYINKLKSCPKIKWTKQPNNDKYFVPPIPLYPEWVYEIEKLTPPDLNYINISKYIKTKDIDVKDFGYREIKAMITFIFRKERFTDGYISWYIESGYLLNLLRRLKKIIYD